MSKRLNFLWIDDDKSRKVTADNLEKNSGAHVHFFDVTEKNIAEQIGLLLKKYDPDLVIVDHKLDKTAGPLRSNKLKSTGATAAEIVKDSNPQIPVICVTKVDRDKDITFAQRSAYDAIFSAGHVNSRYRIFISLAKGFRNLRINPLKSHSELLDSFGCPQVDRPRLFQVLPNDIKTQFDKKGYSSVLWRWMSAVFFERPGFLYDSMWTATLVGAKESSFLKNQHRVQSAKYKGIFANEVDPRWWASQILEILYKNRYDGKQDDPRLLGRDYLHIPKQGYSKCEVSGKDLPDAVAFTDVTNKERRQACLEFTEEHPEFQKLLFFEEIRILSEVP